MELLIIMASVEGSTPSTRPGLNLAFAAEMKVAGGYGTVCVYAYVVYNTTLTITMSVVLNFITKRLTLKTCSGHYGDGCVNATKTLETAPCVSQVWFDAGNSRLAQYNPTYQKTPTNQDLVRKLV